MSFIIIPIILFVRKCFSQECLWPQREAAVSGEPIEVNAYTDESSATKEDQEVHKVS